MRSGTGQSENTTIDLGSWQVTRESVLKYLEAVGDSVPVYLEQEQAPPLALSAYALGALLEKLDLPPGAIHSLQEIETVAPVRFGDRISGVASLERPRRRGNLEFVTAGFVLSNEAGRTVQTGKSTVLRSGAGQS